MYPVRLGYATAVKRIRRLLRNRHHAEALVSAVFMVEKTLRRTLRQLVVSAGFTSKMADRVVGNLRGLDAVKGSWDLYDPANRKLVDLLPSADWQTFKSCAEMRNKLVHGERVYDLEECRLRAQEVLLALDGLRTRFATEYGYDGWTTASRRSKPRLHVDPKVRWTQGQQQAPAPTPSKES